jgi:hypothetical protein
MSFLKNRRFVDIALPLLGGLVIAMLAALIMKYV